MLNHNIISEYFTQLTTQQHEQFAALEGLYREWNEQINVISRQDIDNLYERHVLHSLAIAKFVQFVPQSSVLDVGTGGGFPGLPLAIMFPQVRFVLIDSIGKKIKVVTEIARALQLDNITAIHTNAKQYNERHDFVVSRAVTEFSEFVNYTRKNIHKTSRNTLTNGILYLKGGDLTAELAPFDKRVFVFDIHQHIPLPFFETKKLVYLPL